MKEYHKIQSVFKREQTKPNKLIIGKYTLPEFEYLKDNQWIWTEKVDGTNIRIMWDGENVRFGGRTERAQIPAHLVARLQDLFPVEKFQGLGAMCLYGEGYGSKIQKVGSSYIPDDVDFILFDVRVGEWWLKRDTVEDIAIQLSIDVVPIVGRGTIAEAIDVVSNGFRSRLGNLDAEGLVLKPEVELFTRNGQRIITKIKTRDFS